jgi:CheY-like chemotaxis protein
MKLKHPKDMIFLIVDDVDNMRRSVKAMLKLLHYGKEFYEAANGRDAWKLLQGEEVSIDFIISDYNMPVLSGTDLLNLVRSDGKMRDIPFLMITAEANMDVVAEAAEHDVDAYMTKPFVTATLEQKITELLEHTNNPSPFTRHLLNSRLLEEKGDIDGAIEEATKASAINKNSSRPYRELGRLFLKKDDLQKGQLCFEKAVDLNRLDVSSYHALGQIYYRQDKMDKALENFSRAMEISPRHSDRALSFAKLLLKKKKLAEAEKVIKLVLKSKAGDIDFKEDIADSCNEFGLYDLGVKTYLEVLKADPERFYLHKKIGVTLYKAEEYKDAVNYLEKAAEKFTEDAELFLLLAKSYMSMKMLMRADKWAARVIKLDQNHAEARDILRQCIS